MKWQQVINQERASYSLHKTGLLQQFSRSAFPLVQLQVMTKKKKSCQTWPVGCMNINFPFTTDICISRLHRDGMKFPSSFLVADWNSSRFLSGSSLIDKLSQETCFFSPIAQKKTWIMVGSFQMLLSLQRRLLYVCYPMMDENGNKMLELIFRMRARIHHENAKRIKKRNKKREMR